MTSTLNIPVWDDHSWRDLPTLDADIDTDICVVGLGGSGLACIGELQALGARVVGIDARDVAAGAAGRNGGFLLAGAAAFHHDSVASLGRERALALYRLTMMEIDRMLAETPEAIRRTGSLRVAMSDEELEDCDRQFEAMIADGLPVERYSGPEGTGLLFPFDCAFNPLLRCRMLASRLRDAGVALYGGTPAVDISGERVVTPYGVINCSAVIVAVDGNLDLILPELSSRVRTARLQMIATEPTEEITLPRPVYARWGYEYWQQLPDRRIALGGFRDRFLEDEWTSSGDPSEPLQGELERFLREGLGVRAAITHRWAAPVGYTESGMPVIDEVRQRVWAVGGYSGTGNVVGAICGRAAAQLALLGTSELAKAFSGENLGARS
jgi:glycine/D-amino acid oxidase-like deaminating enzyme